MDFSVLSFPLRSLRISFVPIRADPWIPSSSVICAADFRKPSPSAFRYTIGGTLEATMVNGESRRRLAVHGPVVELDCSVTALDESLDSLLGKFTVPGWPEAFVPITGVIHPFEHSEVLPRLPASAR